MQSVVSTVLEVARSRGASKVLAVSMKVGELTHLNPEQLRFAFEALTEGTLAQGAELHIELVKAKVRCRQCGYEGGLPSTADAPLQPLVLLVQCPKCGGFDVEVAAGRECTLTSVKVALPPLTSRSLGA